MTWKHVVALVAGAGVAVAGALTGGAAAVALMPIASAIVAGTLGQAQGEAAARRRSGEQRTLEDPKKP